MDNTLRERYYQVFRTTNALVKLEYSDLMSIMDKAGLDDKFCEEFMAKHEAWAKDVQAESAEQIEKTRPTVPEQNVDIFQRGLLEAIKTEADLQLLNTL